MYELAKLLTRKVIKRSNAFWLRKNNVYEFMASISPKLWQGR